MNVETLNESVSEFKARVLTSGLKRDIEDYIGSLPANQNNILSLRDIATKLRDKLEAIHASDLPDCLELLLPSDKAKPFTRAGYRKNLDDLLKDNAVPQDQFFQKLNKQLAQLKMQIDSNIIEVDRIEEFIRPYVTREKAQITDEEKVILSVVFKDPKTTKSLKSFSRVVTAWNRVLPQYQQIVSSKTPTDIEILGACRT